MDFSATKAMFYLPKGVIYLDGNSLGALPKQAHERVAKMMAEEWGELLIRGWNQAGWMEKTSKIGDRLGQLIGAPQGTVVMGDTLTIKLYQALASALEMRPERKVILSDSGNFPSDLYMAEGLIRSLKQNHELRLVEPYAVADAIDRDVAVLMLTEVDYRTGRLHNMAHLTQKAHEMGILTIWDLAHSAGALPVDLIGAGADFAVGCTYKYLNGGPGAPAFIFVAPEHIEQVRPALCGWLGHEAPFAFERNYRAATGIERMRVGTPSIISLTSLEAALDIWEGINLQEIHSKSIELSELFIELVESRCPELSLVSPRESAQRGSQVSFRFPQGDAAMQALIDHGVIGDFRVPDIMRFGITPLYLDDEDIQHAVAILEEIMNNKVWEQPKYKIRQAVT